MTADVNQDRRVTVVTQGLYPVLSEGSRLFWALPSPVHEGLGYRGFAADRIQGDAVTPHALLTAQSRITSRHSSREPLRPDPQCRAPCSPPSRRGLATPQAVVPLQRRPALTAAAPGAPESSWSERRNTPAEQRNSPNQE